MLIQVTLENWMSFRDKTTFSMVAGKEKQHNERVPRIKRHGLKILPFAAIYGGNASGKSNFYKAMVFAKELITRGTRDKDESISVNPFRLDGESSKKPTTMSFAILIGEKIYEYSFSVNNKEVVEEKLLEIIDDTEHELFYRSCNIRRLGIKPKSKPLEFVLDFTRSNQLFLTNSIDQQQDKFKDLFQWFKLNLFLIDPEVTYTAYHIFLDDSDMAMGFNATLSGLDTGVALMQAEDIDIEKSAANNELDELRTEFAKNPTKMFINKGNLVYLKKGDGIIAKKFITYHKTVDGEKVPFMLRNESDGTRRIIELLPLFILAMYSVIPVTIIIDEIDRSLHTHMVRSLIESYLEQCSVDGESQIIATTHDVNLMDQSILRRDEMWVVERKEDGSSKMFSFGEFNLRYDRDIRKYYLQGRLGGVPKINKYTFSAKPETSGC